MLTVAIPQLYGGASGQKGAYNRQEVGLARAFAALGCRAVVLYPDAQLTEVQTEDLEPFVRVLTCPARMLGVSAFYRSWQPLLDEGVQAVHLMGDNALGVPGLEKFCRKHDIFLYHQIGALYSTSHSLLLRGIMDMLLVRNLAVYRRTPTFAKTPSMAGQLQRAKVPCRGVMPVGLDTAIIPPPNGSRAEAREALGLAPDGKYLLFVGRIDPYKHPLDLVPLLAALPGWEAIVIGQGSLSNDLREGFAAAGLAQRCHIIPKLDNRAVHIYYLACDVFVNLNPDEIFGMSLLEAMYAGCPPVARHAPGPDFIIEDGVSGLLTGQGVAALAEAVRRAAADPELGPAAQKRIREHFLWGSSAEQALALLAEQGLGRTPRTE